MTSSNRGPLAGQIGNRNFLSPVGFKFSLAKFPKISFFCNSASIPEISLGTFQQPSYLKQIDIPGEKLTYGDLDIRFLVDENMENYMAVHNWLRGLGFPESPQQFIDKTTDSDGIRDLEEQFCDGGLHILNVSLTSLNFDATETDINYFTASASFRYTVYNITDKSGDLL